jgi:hypothetical protein
MTINDPRDDQNYQVGGDKYKAVIEKTAAAGIVDPTTVLKFHTNADTDASHEAMHHTLGPRNGQAAAGDHNHQIGSNYKAALSGVTISGSRSGGAALVSVIAALVKLGANDSTTA